MDRRRVGGQETNNRVWRCRDERMERLSQFSFVIFTRDHANCFSHRAFGRLRVLFARLRLRRGGQLQLSQLWASIWRGSGKQSRAGRWVVRGQSRVRVNGRVREVNDQEPESEGQGGNRPDSPETRKQPLIGVEHGLPGHEAATRKPLEVPRPIRAGSAKRQSAP